MKKVTLFSLPLFIFVLILVSASQLTNRVQAYGGNVPPPQESALESAASCDNQDYSLPSQIPVTGESPDTSAYLTQPLEMDEPVLGDVGLYIEEINEINEIDETFTVEGLFEVIWCDPRQAHDDRKEFIVLVEDDAQDRLNEIWWPDITFTNEVGARDVADKELVIHKNGTVEYREKFTVTLDANYDLMKFPFDKQQLEIQIESFVWDSEYLQLHVEKDYEHFSKEFQIAEWHVDKESINPTIEPVMEVSEREPFSRFTMVIDITRQFGFYLWKVLFPLFLLVVMCFAVFWMDDEGLSSRLGVSFTGVLTVVAYQFIATASLPKVPYITLMDAYISISFVIMSLTIFQSLIVNTYNKTEKKEKALKVDKVSRIVFPLGYVFSLVGTTAWFMIIL